MPPVRRPLRAIDRPHSSYNVFLQWDLGVPPYGSSVIGYDLMGAGGISPELVGCTFEMAIILASAHMESK